MPYASDTLVPRALIRLMNARIGEQKTKALLHDYLENPDDKLTRAEIAKTIGGKIVIERDVHYQDGDYVPVTRLDFSSTIDGQKWTGEKVALPPLPESVSKGLIDKPMNSVVEGPLYGEEPIVEVEAFSDKTIVTCDKSYIEVGKLGISPFTHLAGLWRVTRRQRRTARKLNAHEGYKAVHICMGLVMGLGLGVVLGLISMVVTTEMRSPSMNGIANAGFLIGMLGGAYLTIRFAAGMTDEGSIVRKYAENVIVAAVKNGITTKQMTTSPEMDNA